MNVSAEPKTYLIWSSNDAATQYKVWALTMVFWNLHTACAYVISEQKTVNSDDSFYE